MCETGMTPDGLETKSVVFSHWTETSVVIGGVAGKKKFAEISDAG